jgi:hypothetical protein
LSGLFYFLTFNKPLAQKNAKTAATQKPIVPNYLGIVKKYFILVKAIRAKKT